MELETILRVLARKWRIILPIFIITFGATVFYTVNQPRTYEARATYVAKLTPVFEDDRDFATVLSILSSRVEISTTYAQVANSRRLFSLAAQKLGLSPENRPNLAVNSRLIPGTNIIEIVVRGTDPILARDFANALGETTTVYVQNVYETFTLAPLDEAITPRAPVQPKVTLNLILGGILGLALGAAIAFVSYYYETSDKSPKDDREIGTVNGSLSADEASLMQLRQDITNIHFQFEATRRELDQIHTALRRTNYYAKDIRSVIRDLEAHFERNHNDDKTAGNVEDIGE